MQAIIQPKHNDHTRIKPIMIENLLPQEVFAPVTWDIVPFVYDYYLVSNCGRVYHKYTGRFLKPGINGAGYYYVMMSTFNNPKPIQIHRLEMKAFCPIDNSELYDVNHKDGNKLNNFWWNLEWMTHSDNIKHAYETGLHNIYSNITNDTAILICELLQEGKYTNKQISEMVGRGSSEHIVSDIKKRQCWKHISKDYTFYQRPGRLFSDEMIENICIYFSNYSIGNLTINDHCRNALSFYGYDNSDRYVETARKIFVRKYYTNISNKYIFC